MTLFKSLFLDPSDHGTIFHQFSFHVLFFSLFFSSPSSFLFCWVWGGGGVKSLFTGPIYQISTIFIHLAKWRNFLNGPLLKHDCAITNYLGLFSRQIFISVRIIWRDNCGLTLLLNVHVRKKTRKMIIEFLK